ncbi:MAG: hypothetical protein KGR98_03730 [Verrucomicrobia bacterium]|nr:hypothetical protein [Verrucomicrobiota bacterium]MDE3098490.1 hypothetical protein [Verrucomicrobiota bacterium]
MDADKKQWRNNSATDLEGESGVTATALHDGKRLREPQALFHHGGVESTEEDIFSH